MLPEILNKIFLYIQSPTNKIMKDYFSFIEKLERNNQLYRIKMNKFIYMIWLNTYHGFHIFDYNRLCNTECKCFNIYMSNGHCYCPIHEYI
jgi:hypothetical protein